MSPLATARHTRRARAAQAAAVVGVDAGKFSHTLVIRPRGAADSAPVSLPTTRAGFEQAVTAIARASAGAAPAEVLVGIEFAGNYGVTFARFLAARGYDVVSVLPAHTKRWKEVMHHGPLKTDAKDALGITDLTAQGHYCGFPFLAPPYAELRSLVSTRTRLTLLRRAALTRLRTTLQVLFPEYEQIFPCLTKRTPLVLLRAFPAPADLLRASPRRVLAVLAQASRGHVGIATCAALRQAAATTLGAPGAAPALRDDVVFLLEQLALYERQLAHVEAQMRRTLAPLAETPYLLSIPKVAPVTAAVFLGSIGDPQSNHSAREVLTIAGLSLVERSSGILKGQRRISKRGRPEFRAAAYMLAVRSIRRDGLFRAEYERLLARNGGQKMRAVVAVSRSALRLLFSIARDRRLFTPEPPRREPLERRPQVASGATATPTAIVTPIGPPTPCQPAAAAAPAVRTGAGRT
jgi:transposase